MSRSELLAVGKPEYKIRTGSRRIVYQINRIIYNLRSKIKGFCQKHFPWRKEYYMDFTKNRIVVRWERKKKHQMGTWIMHNGRLVKVQESIYRIPMAIYGWREVDGGMWDDTFQCYVKDKNHYRQLLKEHGCRQKESYNYCKSAKAGFKDRVKATSKQFEKAYAKAISELPVSEREQI